MYRNRLALVAFGLGLLVAPTPSTATAQNDCNPAIAAQRTRVVELELALSQARAAANEASAKLESVRQSRERALSTMSTTKDKRQKNAARAEYDHANAELDASRLAVGPALSKMDAAAAAFEQAAQRLRDMEGPEPTGSGPTPHEIFLKGLTQCSPATDPAKRLACFDDLALNAILAPGVTENLAASAASNATPATGKTAGASSTAVVSSTSGSSAGSSSSGSSKSVYVKGYTKKDGTRVSAHTRTRPRSH